MILYIQVSIRLIPRRRSLDLETLLIYAKGPRNLLDRTDSPSDAIESLTPYLEDLGLLYKFVPV